MKPHFEHNDLETLLQELSYQRKITIIGHVSPDGDAVGSTLAISMILKKMGHETTVVYPTFFPEAFNCISGAEETIIAKQDLSEAEKALQEAEIIFCMDFNEPKRVERLQESLSSASAFKVLIDHHLHPSDFAQVILSYPTLSSTCLLTYHLIKALKWEQYIDKAVAEAIYLGMMTDTGGFSYNSEDPSIYTTISELLTFGLSKDELTAHITRSYSIDKLRLNAHAILNKMTVFPEYKSAIITMTHEEKERFHYKVGDTEGLVNEPLVAKEIYFSIFIFEVDDYTKLSFRSKDPFACNDFARIYFNGGGHRNASGAESRLSIEETYEKVVQALQELHP